MSNLFLTAKKALLPSLLVTVVLVSSLFFYISFSSYVPKSLENVQEVKGISDEALFDLPFPKDSERLAFNQTSETKQVTIISNRSPDEIVEFYKVILSGDGWAVESENKKDGFTTLRFIKNDEKVTVVTSRQDGEESSIASIELSK